jgi:hypothetical protein
LIFPEEPEERNNSKILLALMIIVVGQVGACSVIGGEEFYVKPIFCTAVGDPFEPNALRTLMLVYAVGLLLNAFVIAAGVIFRKATLVAAIFCSLILVCNIAQIFLLKYGLLWCDAL